MDDIIHTWKPSGPYKVIVKNRKLPNIEVSVYLGNGPSSVDLLQAVLHFGKRARQACVTVQVNEGVDSKVEKKLANIVAGYREMIRELGRVFVWYTGVLFIKGWQPSEIDDWQDLRSILIEISDDLEGNSDAERVERIAARAAILNDLPTSTDGDEVDCKEDQQQGHRLSSQKTDLVEGSSTHSKNEAKLVVESSKKAKKRASKMQKHEREMAESRSKAIWEAHKDGKKHKKFRISKRKRHQLRSKRGDKTTFVKKETCEPD